jgi:hypothetical protein
VRPLPSVEMRVVFFIHDERKRICGWTALRGERTQLPGALMGYGNGVPHDLVQYIIEAATRCEYGFWGLVAIGATFQSTGRRRTKPGRAVIAAHRRDLQASEHLANTHVAQWRAGMQTPVTAALDLAQEQWDMLAVGDTLVFEWPSPHGRIERHVRRNIAGGLRSMSPGSSRHPSQRVRQIVRRRRT